MKKLLLLALVLILLLPTVMGDTCAYFFYGEGCPHCGKVESYLAGYENATIYTFEIYNNRSNLMLL